MSRNRRQVDAADPGETRAGRGDHDGAGPLLRRPLLAVGVHDRPTGCVDVSPLDEAPEPIEFGTAPIATADVVPHSVVPASARRLWELSERLLA